MTVKRKIIHDRLAMKEIIKRKRKMREKYKIEIISKQLKEEMCVCMCVSLCKNELKY